MGQQNDKSKKPKSKKSGKVELSEKDYKFFMLQTGLSKPQIKALFDQFKENNPDGKLDKSEFIKLYNSLRTENKDTLNDISEMIFNAFDTDKNGFISFDEFLVAYSLTSRGDLTSKLSYAFDLYDLDNNASSGTLDENEMRAVLNAMLDLLGADKNVQNVQIITEQCIQELDRNGDGKVSKAEFIEGLKKNYSLRCLMSPFN